LRDYVELTDEDVLMLRLVHKPSDPRYGSAALALLFEVPRVRIERAIERKSHKHLPLNMVPGGHLVKGKTARAESAVLERKQLREYIDQRRANQGKAKLEDTPQPRAERRTARQIRYAAVHGENARRVSVWFKQPVRKARHKHPDGLAPADAEKRLRISDTLAAKYEAWKVGKLEQLGREDEIPKYLENRAAYRTQRRAEVATGRKYKKAVEDAPPAQEASVEEQETSEARLEADREELMRRFRANWNVS
jgi:hypothetical protein